MNAIWFKCFLSNWNLWKTIFFSSYIQRKSCKCTYFVAFPLLLVYYKKKEKFHIIFSKFFFYIFNTSRRHVWYFEIVKSCKIKSLLFWEFIFPSLKCRQVFILVMKILFKCCCCFWNRFIEKHCFKVQCK